MVFLTLDSAQTRGGYHRTYSSILFSPVFLERPSPSFGKGGGKALGYKAATSALLIAGFRHNDGETGTKDSL